VGRRRCGAVQEANVGSRATGGAPHVERRRVVPKRGGVAAHVEPHAAAAAVAMAVQDSSDARKGEAETSSRWCRCLAEPNDG
jgi:hypothetical protein